MTNAKSRRRRPVPRFMGRIRTLADPEAPRSWMEISGTSKRGAGGSARATGVVMHTQQAENWCWAAAIDCLLAARGRAVGQAAVVARHVGHDCPPRSPRAESPHDCTVTLCPNPCNGPHSIDVALGGWSIASQRIVGPSRAELQEAIRVELTGGQPVVVRMAGASSSHIILIVGMTAIGATASVTYLSPYFYDGQPFPVTEKGTLFTMMLDGMGIASQRMSATHFFRIAR